jgi:imidazolonepropionase-like amidohydrolase
VKTLFALALAAAALLPQDAKKVVAVRAARVYTVSGGVIERGVIVIEDGKIADVRASGEIPPGATLIDAPEEIVVPGLIDAHTSLAEDGRDAEESVAPDVRASDGYDFYASNWRLLSGGVTTVGLTPGSQRLLSGRGAVIKTAGRGPRERTLAAARGLRVTLGEAPKNPPTIFTPPVPASADDPIRPAKRQYPASRMGAFAALRQAGPGLKAAGQPFWVQAQNEDDLIKVCLLAEELGVGLVLLDAAEAPRIADLLSARKVPVVYGAGYAPGRRDLSDGSRPSLEAAGSLEGAAALARAGVRFALHAPEDADLSELLFIAAAAVRAGLPEADALAAVTLRPAEILGVADRVGALRKGADADLVFLSADPFAASSTVRRVMVDGEMVFVRKETDVQTYRAVRDTSAKGKDLLVIRGARILTVTQGVIPDGEVFVEAGKIVHVGRGRPVPAHAKVVEAAGLTLVPGFVDADSHLGFHADRTEAGLRAPRAASAPPQAAVAPSSLVRLDDPALREAAASGVTAILLAPDASGVCSVVKLSGSLVRDAAALKFTVQGGGAGYQALKETLTRGKRYHDEWEAFEKAKREPPRPADPLSGPWKGTLEAPEHGVKAEFTAELKLDGTRVSGSFQSSVTGGAAEAAEGTFDGTELKLAKGSGTLKAELALRLAAPDLLKGTWRVTGGPAELKGTAEARRAPPAPAGPKAEPKKDDALEPYRKLFAKEIPPLVEVRDAPGIEAATRALRGDFGLDAVILGGADAAFAGDLIFDRSAGAVLGPDFIAERKGARVNAAEALASQGVVLSFSSSGHSSTRHLPLTAAWAVRNGMDPFDALKALTIAPARLLKLEGRLGAIERGRDADLVLFAGDPFAPTSRVRMVIIDGKIVHEAR